MLRLGDQEIIEINSKLFLLSDNRTKKDSPSLLRGFSKDNQKNMYYEMLNYRVEA